MSKSAHSIGKGDLKPYSRNEWVAWEDSLRGALSGPDTPLIDKGSFLKMKYEMIPFSAWDPFKRKRRG